MVNLRKKSAKFNYYFQISLSINIGITTPITIDEVIKTQLRFEFRTKVWTKNDKINTERTTASWANSIPNANSNKGKILSLAEPAKIELK